MSPFAVNGDAEAIAIFALVVVTVALFIYTEMTDRTSPVVKIVNAGLMFYLFSITEAGILQVCFLGLTIYNLFKVVRRV